MKRSFVLGSVVSMILLLPGPFLLLNKGMSFSESNPESSVSRQPDPDIGAGWKPEANSNRPKISGLIYSSADGGKTWENISEGLPEEISKGIQNSDFISNEQGIYLRSGNNLYHKRRNSKSASWTNEKLPGSSNRIAPGISGIIAFGSSGQIYMLNADSKRWTPAYTDFQGNVLGVYEMASGKVFIRTDKGLFRSDNGRGNWKNVYEKPWVMELVESDGLLLATSANGIIQSHNHGDDWKPAISEGGAGIGVEKIGAGVAAITFDARSRTRRLRVSYDGGKNWQPIDEGIRRQNSFLSSWQYSSTELPEQALITSVVQLGKYLYCGYPTGVLRSADHGKSWELLLPSVENRVFNLSVSGNVIYALSTVSGC